MNLIKEIYLKRILIPVVALLLLVFPKNINAQGQTSAFVMSSVGLIQNFANNSMAVTFSSSSSCLSVQNGAAVLTGESGTGLFSINCAVDVKYNTLGIKLYPNPVGAYTKVKFMNVPPLNEKFSIIVWGSQGEKISTINATGNEIYQGKLMNFSSLVCGSYFIQIGSERYQDALKFIKVK